MGRGHESEIKIPDISVSRCHAMIHFREGQFCVEDNQSKFGTLVKAQSGIVIVEHKQTITVQIGRTVLICSGGEKAWMKMLNAPILS
jgi:pSer/pThr/pTyr-binding forkhead associated (FHA) protein